MTVMWELLMAYMHHGLTHAESHEVQWCLNVHQALLCYDLSF
jgi:hypothetical protein